MKCSYATVKTHGIIGLKCKAYWLHGHKIKSYHNPCCIILMNRARYIGHLNLAWVNKTKNSFDSTGNLIQWPISNSLLKTFYFKDNSRSSPHSVLWHTSTVVSTPQCSQVWYLYLGTPYSLLSSSLIASAVPNPLDFALASSPSISSLSCQLSRHSYSIHVFVCCCLLTTALWEKGLPHQSLDWGSKQRLWTQPLMSDKTLEEKKTLYGQMKSCCLIKEDILGNIVLYALCLRKIWLIKVGMHSTKVLVKKV